LTFNKILRLSVLEKSFTGGTIWLPIPTKKQEGEGAKEGFFRFSVPSHSVLFAGSRFLEVPQRTCQGLIEGFARLGFSFYVGCAQGVDGSFRRALARSPYRDISFVACAFPQRTKPSYSYGLYASVVVPKNLSPKAALHRRTLWMVKRCSMVVLFPECPQDGSWGKGSRLVFQASLYNLKPLFVVSSTPPKNSIHYKVLCSNLFGVVYGFWVVPHPIYDGGACDEEY